MDNIQRENKLLHYVTRAAFEADRDAGRIANTSIAFVDEGRTIYTWGKEYNTSLVQSLIADVSDEIDQIVETWRQNLQQEVDALRALVAQNHTNAINAAREDYTALQERIAQLRTDLQTMQGLYVSKEDYDITDGQVLSLIQWYNQLEGSLTELGQEVDLINGKIITEARYVQLANESVSSYMSEYTRSLNLRFDGISDQIVSLEERLSLALDTAEETVIGRLMDASNGILKDYVTYTDLNEGLSQMVSEVLDAKTPSWSVLVQRVSDVEQAENELAQRYTSLSTTLNGFSTVTEDITALDRRLTQIETSVGNNEATVTLAAIKEVLDGDTNKEIAAKIFLLANANGSNITLDADNINLSGNTTALGSFVAARIAAANITANAVQVTDSVTGNTINIDSTNGIKFTNGTTGSNPFVLTMGGRGQLGCYFNTDTNEYEPAISWGDDGVLAINSALIGSGGGGGGGTTYVQNPYDDQWIRTWQSQINSWKGTINTWKSTLDAQNLAQAYLTAAGIVFDNSANGHIVAVTSTPTNNGTVPAGVSHTAVGGANDGEHGYYLKNDGTGEVAFGNIAWDAQGNITIKNLTIDTMTSNAGSEYNLVDFYKWVSVPVPTTGYDSNSVWDFDVKDVLSFRIIKNGFVVKDVTISVDQQQVNDTGYSSYVWRSQIPNILESSTYFTKDCTNSLSVENTNPYTYDSTLSQGFGFYDFRCEFVPRQQIIHFFNNLPATVRQLVFYNDSNESIFDPTDTIYISVPDQKLTFNVNELIPGTLPNIRFTTESDVTRCGLIGVTVANTQLLTVEEGDPVPETNLLRQRIKEDIAFVLGNNDSSEINSIFNALFDYNDDPLNVKNAVLGMRRGNVESASAALVYKNHALALSRDCWQLNMIAQYYRLYTPGDNSADWSKVYAQREAYVTSIRNDISNDTVTRGEIRIPTSGVNSAGDVPTYDYVEQMYSGIESYTGNRWKIEQLKTLGNYTATFNEISSTWQ